jgi:DUF1707 SHOCT-like domain/Domain of unknown function (DUF4190)
MNDNDIPPSADHERGQRATVAPAIRYAGHAAASAAGGDRAKMRASDTDRDRVAELLNVAYSEGRLSKEEYDGRLERAFSARTYADLDQIVADLPAARATVVTPQTWVARTNGLAIASLACALAQFVFGPVTTIPAIVFGHMARHQIKRTGEQGAGLALAGLILGWATVILGLLLLLIVGVAMTAGMHGAMH